VADHGIGKTEFVRPRRAAGDGVVRDDTGVDPDEPAKRHIRLDDDDESNTEGGNEDEDGDGI
jgi:hypothetical protein